MTDAIQELNLIWFCLQDSMYHVHFSRICPIPCSGFSPFTISPYPPLSLCMCLAEKLIPVMQKTSVTKKQIYCSIYISKYVPKINKMKLRNPSRNHFLRKCLQILLFSPTILPHRKRIFSGKTFFL